MYGVKISGLGKAVPYLQVTNEELSKLVDTSDEWIESRTGISTRYIAVTETTTELAIKAGKEALEDSGLLPENISLVIVATVSPDYTMPSTACRVAEALNIEGATCFDLTAACSGFIYASEVAMSLIKQGSHKNALIIGAEVFSKVVNWEDRNTCVLFGDGAGAVIYQFTEENKLLSIRTGSDGKGSDLITLPTASGNRTFRKTEDKEQFIQMDGREVYRFATTMVPKDIEEVLKEVDYTASDIDYYIIHQANARIMDSIAKKLNVSPEKFFKNLSTHGNTCAASIPMALYDARAQLKVGDKIILSGFGAGLTWGTMLIIWDKA